MCKGGEWVDGVWGRGEGGEGEGVSGQRGGYHMIPPWPEPPPVDSDWSAVPAGISSWPVLPSLRSSVTAGQRLGLDLTLLPSETTSPRG